MKSCLLWHPGASISTADVYTGLRDWLTSAGVEVHPYLLEIELELAERSMIALWERGGRTVPKPTPAQMIYRAAKPILTDACRLRRFHGTEWVVIVSGMFQHPDIMVYLRDCGFKLAILLTESPYDLEQESKVAQIANVVFTMERSAVGALRAANPTTTYMQHAYNPRVHVPGEPDSAVPAHDVVFVGTYFEERIEFLASVDWTGIDLGLYGGTGEIDLRTKAGKALRPYIKGGYQRNAQTAALYRRAKIGLNLHRTSKGFGKNVQKIAHAESMNPRCYELAAVGAPFVSDYRAEAADVFGQSLRTFSDAESCGAVIRELLRNDHGRLDGARQRLERVQPHTWDARAAQMVAAIQRYDRDCAGVAA